MKIVVSEIGSSHHHKKCCWLDSKTKEQFMSIYNKPSWGSILMNPKMHGITKCAERSDRFSSWQHWEKESLKIASVYSLGSRAGGKYGSRNWEDLFLCSSRWLQCFCPKEGWRGWGSLAPESSPNRLSRAPSRDKSPHWGGTSRSETKLSTLVTWKKKEIEMPGQSVEKE